MAVKRIQDGVNLTIIFIIFSLLIGVSIIWVYNFMALSEDKLFDNNNKLINKSLGDVAGNYYSYYETKKKTDTIFFNYLDIFSGTKGILVIFFIGFLFFSLLWYYRNDIIKSFERFF